MLRNTPPMNTSRSFGFLFLLALVMGFALTGCQTQPATSLSHAVDAADITMRRAGHPPVHFDVPKAFYEPSHGGWMVKYRTRQGLVRRFYAVFVPDSGTPRIVPVEPPIGEDTSYY
jgi:hypothetical protein